MDDDFPNFIASLYQNEPLPKRDLVRKERSPYLSLFDLLLACLMVLAMIGLVALVGVGMMLAIRAWGAL